jgi:hypothetical protein
MSTHPLHQIIRLCDNFTCVETAVAHVKIIDQYGRVCGDCHPCAAHLDAIRQQHAKRPVDWPTLTLHVIELTS